MKNRVEEGPIGHLKLDGCITSAIKLKFLLKDMENILTLDSLKACETLQVGSKILGSQQIRLLRLLAVEAITARGCL